MSPPIGYRWQPLTDLAEGDLAAASDELPTLVGVWDEQRGRLDDEQVQQFNERLTREWAIETGIIERIYTLDRGTAQLLIERGIDVSLIGDDATDQPPEFVAGIIGDQKAATDWLFDVVKQERPLSTSLIKELHVLMTRRRSTRRDGTSSATRQRSNCGTASTSFGRTTPRGVMGRYTNTAPLSRLGPRWIA